LIWFNPWQHQFEESPLVALLHEIRQHFSLIRKFYDKSGKVINVTVHTALSMLGDLGKSVPVPLPSVSTKDIIERGREYEAERFMTPLSSQRFRDFFEGAIKQVIGNEGRMVIFIDDLDRCEKDVAYRLLESLKLYLNAHNCIYALGLDQAHLEETIARVLSGSEDTRLYRPLAREYLSKMFQHQFLLPVPESMEKYVEMILNPNDAGFKQLLQTRFQLTDQDWPKLVKAFDQNLPHNPRKIKSFISAWKLYVNMLAQQHPPPASLNWRLTLVLTYLGQFEEPLFRKVEEAPGFYSDHLVRFCRDGANPHPLFDGLELPYRAAEAVEQTTGGLSSSSGSPQPQSSLTGTGEGEPAKLLPSPRVFWISRLINELENEKVSVGETRLRQHLLHAGGSLPRPPVPAPVPPLPISSV
jgi:hypothetical protein